MSGWDLVEVSIYLELGMRQPRNTMITGTVRVKESLELLCRHVKHQDQKHGDEFFALTVYAHLETAGCSLESAVGSSYFDDVGVQTVHSLQRYKVSGCVETGSMR